MERTTLARWACAVAWMAVTGAGAADERPAGERSGGPPAAELQRLQQAIVAVSGESAQGLGLLVDADGLVLTTAGLATDTAYLAVQLDADRKLAARRLAADAQHDLAVIDVDFSAAGPLVPARFAQARVGTPLFRIEGPPGRPSARPSGDVTALEPPLLVTSHERRLGPPGSALFDASGGVVGLTTLRGRGLRAPVLRVVDAAAAQALLERARAERAASSTRPSARLLPVDPVRPFPLEALEAAAHVRLEPMAYAVDFDKYAVTVVTPMLAARLERQAADEDGGPAADTRDLIERLGGGRRAVVLVYAQPKLAEGVISQLTRSLTDGASPRRLRPEADFAHMRLLCDAREIEPIHPGRVLLETEGTQDAARVHAGAYVYGPDAFSPDCRRMTLELHSGPGARTPDVKRLDARLIARVFYDFEPWREPPAR
jgi:hypothetical protein